MPREVQVTQQEAVLGMLSPCLLVHPGLLDPTWPLGHWPANARAEALSSEQCLALCTFVHPWVHGILSCLGGRLQ